MKYKIVLIRFPFDNLVESKLRPALCLTDTLSKHNQIIFAAISSNLNNATEFTDIVILLANSKGETGLKVDSVLKTHKLVTATEDIIEKVIGILPESYYLQLENMLMEIFSF